MTHMEQQGKLSKTVLHRLVNPPITEIFFQDFLKGDKVLNNPLACMAYPYLNTLHL